MAAAELQFRSTFSYQQGLCQNITIKFSHNFMLFLQGVPKRAKLKLFVTNQEIMYCLNQKLMSKRLSTSANNLIRDVVEIGVNPIDPHQPDSPTSYGLERYTEPGNHRQKEVTR
jgi:hypothetical protein